MRVKKKTEGQNGKMAVSRGMGHAMALKVRGMVPNMGMLHTFEVFPRAFAQQNIPLCSKSANIHAIITQSGLFNCKSSQI